MQRPSRTWWHALVVTLTACASLSAGPAAATEADMSKLPVTAPFLCLACHVQENPGPGNAALNPFGEDFLANGRRWDENLAQEDSDGDGCLNGAEIGDYDGNGEPDGNVVEQASNPGVVDEGGCPQLVDETTWSALKAIFDGR